MYHHHPIRGWILLEVSKVSTILQKMIYIAVMKRFIILPIWCVVVGDVNPEEICQIVEKHEANETKSINLR